MTREEVIEACRAAKETSRHARDMAARLAELAPSIRVIHAHAELDGALKAIERAAAFLRAGQSAQFRSLVPPAERGDMPRDPRREPDD